MGESIPHQNTKVARKQRNSGSEWTQSKRPRYLAQQQKEVDLGAAQPSFNATKH